MEAAKVVKRKAGAKAVAKRSSLPAETGTQAITNVIKRKSSTSASTGKLKPIKTATVPETAGDLRETFPHYAAAFDHASADGKSVSLAEACKALSQALPSSSSSSSDEHPWSQVESAFAAKEAGKGRIDLSQFCELVREMKVAQANSKLKPTIKEMFNSDDESNVVISPSGKVFFTGYQEEQSVPSPTPPPKHVPPPPQQEVSVGDIAAFALKTTVLPRALKVPTAKYKLTEWRTIRKSFSNYSVPCGKLQFSIDGSQLAATFLEGTAELYGVADFSTGHIPGTAGLSKEALARVAGDASAMLAAGSKKTFGEPSSAMSNLRWSHVNSGKNLMATVDTRGGLHLWEMPLYRSKDQPELLKQVTVGFGSPLSALSFTRDGSTIYAAGTDRYIYAYDVEYMQDLNFLQRLGGEAMVTLEGGTLDNIGGVVGHTDRVHSICSHPFLPNVIFSAGQEGRVLLWDMRQGNANPQIFASGVFRGDTMDISAAGTTLLTGNYEHGNSLLLHEIRMPFKGQAKRPLKTYSWSGDEDRLESGRYHTQSLLNAVGWDAFENKFIIAAGQEDNLARVFEIPPEGSKRPLHIVSTLEGDAPFTSMAISGSGESVAVGMQDGSVKVARIQRVME